MLMNGFGSADNEIPPFARERSVFPAALLIALAIEAALLLGMSVMARNPPQVAAAAQVTHIKIIAPPKPVPPKPVPPQPQPVPPPKPVIPKPAPLPKPVPHHVSTPRPHPVARPRPVVHQPPLVHQAPPPKPQPAPVSAAVQESALQAYAGSVHDAVQSNLRVPQMVKMMNLSGVSEIALRIAPDGQLLSVVVIHSSGIPLIDKAALTAAHATRFPPFTAAMPQGPITVDLSVQLSTD